MSHVSPHFDASGGCMCRCRKCLKVELTEHLDHVDIRQVCVCKRCSQDCPSEGRIVSAKAAQL